MNKLKQYTHNEIIDILLENKTIKNIEFDISTKEFESFTNTQLIKMIDKIGFPNRYELWENLAIRRNCPEVLKTLHEKNYDLGQKGGLMLFKAVVSLKKENSEFLTQLENSNSRAIYLSIINLMNILDEQKKYDSKYLCIFDILIQKISSDFYKEQIEPYTNKIKNNELKTYINKLYFDVFLSEQVSEKPKDNKLNKI